MLPDIFLNTHLRQHSIGTTMIQGEKEVSAEANFVSVLAELVLDEGNHPAREEIELKAEPEAEILPEDAEEIGDGIESLSDLADGEAYDSASTPHVSRSDELVAMEGVSKKGPLLSDAGTPVIRGDGVAIKESGSIGGLARNVPEAEQIGIMSASDLSLPEKTHSYERTREFPLRGEASGLMLQQKVVSARQAQEVTPQFPKAEIQNDTVLGKAVPVSVLTPQEGAAQVSAVRISEVDTAQGVTRLASLASDPLVREIPRGRSSVSSLGATAVTDTPITADNRPASFITDSVVLRPQNTVEVPGVRLSDRQDVPVMPPPPPLGLGAPSAAAVGGQAGFALPTGTPENTDSEQAMSQILEEALSLSERPLLGTREAAGMPRTTGISTNGDSSQSLAVVRQVSEAVRLTSGAGVEIALNPEELGSVRLRLSGADGQMTVVVQAERSETLDLMRRHIDTLSQDFRDIGYGDVSFSFQSGEGDQHSAQEDDTSPVLMAEETSPVPQKLARSTLAMGGGLDIRI